MDLVAALVIPPMEPLEATVTKVGKALSLSFEREDSGRYEEFPAFTATVLGIEIAILGIPDGADAVHVVEDYSIIVQTFVDTEDGDIETNLSTHIKSILQASGIDCKVGCA